MRRLASERAVSTKRSATNRRTSHPDSGPDTKRPSHDWAGNGRLTSNVSNQPRRHQDTRRALRASCRRKVRQTACRRKKPSSAGQPSSLLRHPLRPTLGGPLAQAQNLEAHTTEPFGSKPKLQNPINSTAWRMSLARQRGTRWACSRPPEVDRRWCTGGQS